MDPEFTQDLGFGELVETALHEAEDALQRTTTLPKGDEYVSLSWTSKNMVAYHLATKRQASDKERALVLASELVPFKEKSHNASETIAWVYLRFCEEKDPKYTEAVEMVKRLSADEKIPRGWRETLREKYAALFSVDFGQESPTPE